MSMSVGLKDRVVLITGAGQGIGRIIAREFAAAGAKVVIADVQQQKGDSTVAAIDKAGGKAFFVQTDLRSEPTIRAMVEGAVGHYGRLDVLINNARPYLKVLSYEESFKEWDLAMDVLLKAPALCVRYALPALRRTSGAIINISSTNAMSISHQPASYHVAKAGLLHLTRYLAHELGKDGIRVNAICPGLVDIRDEERKLFSDDPVNKAVAELILPIKKVPTAERIAQVAIFLSSPEAECVTGQVLTVDSGMTLSDQFHVSREVHRKFAKG